MANTPNKLKFQNAISVALWLLTWIPSRMLNKWINLQKNWPRNISNIKDDPYESLVFAYSIKMDQLVPISSITTSKLEEPNSPTYLEGIMTNLNDEEKTTPLGTPRSTMGWNDMNPTLVKPSLV
jgi:hypothetical protein